MNKMKKLLAGTLAFILTLSFAACGSGGNEESSSKKEEDVKVVTENDIAPIAEGQDGTLTYMGLYNLNPTNNDDRTVGLTLFEDKGGKIEYQRVTSSNQYSKLAAAVTAGKDAPDLFSYSTLAFPCQVVQGFYQPLDEIIDFNAPLWSGVKETADQFVLNGKHYVAPLEYGLTAMLFYDKSVITENGFDDPIDLYYEGKWDYDALDDMMSDYVKGASGDEERFGINGWYAPQYVQQTGETLITTDDNITYKSNLDSPKIAAAMDRLANWKKEGYIEPNWIGSAAEAFEKNVLFYSMGTWAAMGTNGPAEKGDWGMVPFPKDPTYEGTKPISSATITTFMWVKGSEKKDAVRAFFECYRIAQTDEKYAKNGREKAMLASPTWTEDDFDLMAEISNPDDNLLIFDPAYGVSSLMGDDFSGFMSGVCLANWLYKSTSVADEQGETYTWTQSKEKFSATVEGELTTINKQIQKFLKTDK